MDISDVSSDDLNAILSGALSAKWVRAGLPKGVGDGQRPLEGHVLAMIFEKPSTRTRVSFDVAIRNWAVSYLCCRPLICSLAVVRPWGIRPCPVPMVDAIMLRTHGEENLHELAAEATVPVINGLTDTSHPCQIMADLLTLQEHKGAISGFRPLGGRRQQCSQRLGFYAAESWI